MKSFLIVGGLVLVAISGVVAMAYSMADVQDTPDWIPATMAVIGVATLFAGVFR